MSDLPLHSSATPFAHRLSVRIIALSGVALALVLAMIAGTLWLSWQLEGAGAAINDAGSLRMRAGNVAIQLGEARAGRPAQVDVQARMLDATLAGLRRGDSNRPLFLPDTPAIQAQFNAVANAWSTLLKPAIALDSATSLTLPSLYLARLPAFVAKADVLVRMIEHENARKTAWLRRSQMALAAMACLGTTAIVHLLYLWFVFPVRRLDHGLARIEQREFGVRLPVDTRDEFGHLAQGFNRMAKELQSLYQDLAQRVDQKTAQFAAQNRELTTLYEMTAFLHEPHDVETLCRGFLARVRRSFDAHGGSVRVLDQDGGKLHLIVSDGLPDTLVEAERCMTANDCLCGHVAWRGVSIMQDLRQLPRVAGDLPTRCAREGFASVGAFGIVSGDTALGSFSLHFRRDRALPRSEVQLLEALGRHLGTALQNNRLASAARQLAVAQERHLFAQGLHDSIAQSLNFLKMQVHMLDSAAANNDLLEVREMVPLLRGGIEESYEDVRELLMNFRTKLGAGDLEDTVRDTVTRFERQSAATVSFGYDEAEGPPLPPDQQLQVLFILQEALSNIRKHAFASKVRITIRNDRNFVMLIEDDGEGYDPADIADRGEAHVGFHIMHERAARLGAQLKLTGEPGKGARVELRLAGHERYPS